MPEEGEMAWHQVLEVASEFGIIVTAIGVTVAYSALRANHDWNRRSAAAELLEQWNVRTGPHRKAIERMRPGLLDVVNGQLTQLTIPEAEEVYKSQPEDPNWELRFHIIELLNYFEYIAAVYRGAVADARMVEASFKRPILRYHDVLLENFIAVFKRERGMGQDEKPWGPFHDMVAEWNRGPDVPRRRATDVVFRRRQPS
jgi:hypothetical protein